MTPKVYVLIDQKYKDRVTGEMVSKFDFSSAERYGDLVFLLASNASTRDPETNGDLADGLANITDDDYILPVGSPVLILLAGAYAAIADVNRLNVLEWERDRDDRSSGHYLPTTVNIL